jgi:hypothetical protein
MESSLPAEREHSFGVFTPLSTDEPKYGRSGKREPLFLPDSEDDYGKYTSCSTGSKNEISANAPFLRASV